MEAALGMSYTGKRAMVSMKHVGLNVAADPFVNSAITGANGGLIIVVADDPSMHSSQNEQDSRSYAQFALVPAFEPSSQQEAYDMVFDALDYSEEMQLPVVMRITTRLAHSRADVQRREVRPQNEMHLPENRAQFTLLPVNARRNYIALIDKQVVLKQRSAECKYNKLTEGKDTSLGIVACGIAYNYVMECFRDTECPYPVLKISQYPLPTALIEQLAGTCEKLLVVEEGTPVVEEALRGLVADPDRVRGRLTDTLPRTGELTPDHLAAALGLKEIASVTPPPEVRPRPPQLCRGCPHRDSYEFLKEALADHEQKRVFSDIGCYTLGALPPFNAIDSCVDMGASVTMAKGAADAGVHPSIAVIGDSTFTHSGITGLLDAVYEQARIVVMILDNDTTAMTGMQESMATGRLEQICTGVGVDPAHIRVLTPLKKHHDENVAALNEEIDYDGVSVVIAKRPCVHLKRRV
jgi:indolepyruvate ferredoxin oxidoreductase alpha subunit